MKAMKAAPKAMKAMKAIKAKKAKPRATGKALGKGGIADALATACEMKKSECSKIIDALAEMGGAQVKSAGKFVLPGLVMIKTRRKPATKAGKRLMFGKEVTVAAKPARPFPSRRPRNPSGKAVCSFEYHWRFRLALGL